MLERIDHVESKVYAELFYVKVRLSADEREVAALHQTLASLHQAVVQQWVR
ncbi:hypothetical protein [Paraburkholderia youngii]|uniref:hypothetical protein n=1 Tax=Paraburkholderia youngii TaxID=2782701 RepID=UPI001595BB56|nr:hypothetical protein [Paraburkholderia youngii]